MTFHEVWSWQFSTDTVRANFIPSEDFKKIVFAVFGQCSLGYLASFISSKFLLSQLLAVVSLFAGMYIFHFIHLVH